MAPFSTSRRHMARHGLIAAQGSSQSHQVWSAASWREEPGMQRMMLSF